MNSYCTQWKGAKIMLLPIDSMQSHWTVFMYIAGWLIQWKLW